MTTSNPLRLGLVPSQVYSGAGRTVTCTPESARLAAKALVATASVSARIRTLGPSLEKACPALKLVDGLTVTRDLVLAARIEVGASLARGCGPLVATTGCAFMDVEGSVSWSLLHASCPSRMAAVNGRRCRARRRCGFRVKNSGPVIFSSMPQRWNYG